MTIWTLQNFLSDVPSNGTAWTMNSFKTLVKNFASERQLTVDERDIDTTQVKVWLRLTPYQLSEFLFGGKDQKAGLELYYILHPVDVRFL